jgi:hypothetical protein
MKTLKKFDGWNLYTWKLKVQMYLMNKNVWGIVKGSNKSPTYPNNCF